MCTCKGVHWCGVCGCVHVRVCTSVGCVHVRVRTGVGCVHLHIRVCTDTILMHTYMYMYHMKFFKKLDFLLQTVKIVTNMINFATIYIFKTSIHVKEPNTSSGCLSKCMYTCATAKMFDDNIMHVLYYAHMEVHIIYIVSLSMYAIHVNHQLSTDATPTLLA